MRSEQARYLLELSIGDAASDFNDISSSIKLLVGNFSSTYEKQLIKEVDYSLIRGNLIEYRNWEQGKIIMK